MIWLPRTLKQNLESLEDTINILARDHQKINAKMCRLEEQNIRLQLELHNLGDTLDLCLLETKPEIKWVGKRESFAQKNNNSLNT